MKTISPACQALIDAIRQENVREVIALLSNADVWQEENYGNYEDCEEVDLDHPLVLATRECGKDRITEVFKTLVRSQFLINNLQSSYISPISTAIREGNIDAANLLIDNGALVNWPSETMQVFPPPLACAVFMMGRTPPDRVLEMIDLLYARGGEVNPIDSPSPLHYAMSAPDRNEMRGSVLKKLIEYGANVNQVGLVTSRCIYKSDTHFGTPLHAYSASGVEAVQILLDNGADLSIKNNDGLDAIEFFEEYRVFSPTEAETVDKILSLFRNNLQKPTTQRSRMNTFDQVPIIADQEEPKCMCIFLLDVSYSMIINDAMKQLNEGLKSFATELKNDSLASKRTEVAVVTFGPVKVHTDFISGRDFIAPELVCDNGGTPLSEAVITAADMIHARKIEYKREGVLYYRPMVFLITDGEPTDGDDELPNRERKWPNAIRRVKSDTENKRYAFFPIGVDDANMDRLSELGDRQPIKLKGHRFSEFFSWLHRSLSAVSQSAPEDKVILENPTGPSGWGEV